MFDNTQRCQFDQNPGYIQPVIYSHKEHPVLTTVDSFIASQVLGDGSLYIRRKQLKLDGTFPISLSWNHSSKKAGNYTLFKWEIAASLGLKPWACHLDISKNRYGGAMLKSGCSLRDQKWVDIDPVVAADLLDPFGVLLWYLDDGFRRKNRVAYLCSNAFSKEQNKEFAELLNRKFDFDLRVAHAHHSTTEKLYYDLVFTTESFRKLVDLNREKIAFVPRCMWYKLDMKYRFANTLACYNLSRMYDFPAREEEEEMTSD